MNRREFLERLGTLPAIPVVSPLLSAIFPATAPFRRVRPSDPGWPAPEAWA
jgi:hypothetical protein